MRRVNRVDDLIRDFRYGLRLLRHSPGFTSIAVLTLTLGIGANTAIFSVVNSVLLRPLPYSHPDQLVRIYETNTSIADSRESVRAPNFLEWRARAGSFSGIAALRWQPSTMTGGAGPEFIQGQRVTPNMLNILGVQPVLGRDFSSDDAVPGRDRVALLSHELWMRRFTGDAGILGSKIQLNFEPYTIIGVLPAGFRTPSLAGAVKAEFLLPLTFTDAEIQGKGFLNNHVFARLRSGVLPAQAQVEMDGVFKRLTETYSFNRGRGVYVAPLLEQIVGNYRTSLLVMFAAAGVILLISCANLANGLLARGAGQQREIAIRLAIGASRAATIRQLLMQNLILAALGCVCGVLTAFWALEALHALAPSNLARMDEVAIDGATLAFAAAVSVLTALAFGLFPAFHLSGSSPYDAMKARGTGAIALKVLRWRNMLIVAQVALSIVLLVGAGLLIKSFARLRGVDMGFQPDRTLAMKILLPRTRYPEHTKHLRFFADLANRVRTLPGVEAVAYTSGLPMRGIWYGSINVKNPEVAAGPNDICYFQIVSPEYFRALSIRLLGGRLFGDADHTGSQPVIVVNNAFARRYWPNSNPVGQQVSTGTIVGVVADVHLGGPANAAPVQIYYPAGQAQSLPVPPTEIAVRVTGDPRRLINAIEREVRAIDPEQPISAVRTMEEEIAQSTSSTRFSTLLLALFAGLALLISAVGVYGVVSYSVAQRAPEIGIRMAVGARPADILGLVLRQIASPVVLGAVIGVTASLALTRFVASMLFHVAPRDPAAFGAAIAVLPFAGLAAALLPARRAIRVDPISVLRAD